MNQAIADCPQCQMANTYFDGEQFICPDCTFEWNDTSKNDSDSSEQLIVKDCNGNLLQDGDAVILAKDLKVKGSSMVIKKGTKIKSVRLVDSDHNIDCKVDGIKMALKSEFLKKA